MMYQQCCRVELQSPHEWRAQPCYNGNLFTAWFCEEALRIYCPDRICPKGCADVFMTVVLRRRLPLYMPMPDVSVTRCLGKRHKHVKKRGVAAVPRRVTRYDLVILSARWQDAIIDMENDLKMTVSIWKITVSIWKMTLRCALR